MGKPLHIGHNILKLVSGKLHIHNLMSGNVGRSKRERPVDDQDISYSGGYMDTTPRSFPGNLIGDEPGTREQQPPSGKTLVLNFPCLRTLCIYQNVFRIVFARAI